VAWRRGDFRPIVALHQELLARMREGAPRWGLAASLEALAKVCAARREPAKAARLFGAAEALRSRLSSARPPTDHPEYEQVVSAARAALGDDAFRKHWEEGQAMTLAQSIACALDAIQE
jgi:hypothetical protein